MSSRFSLLRRARAVLFLMLWCGGVHALAPDYARSQAADGTDPPGYRELVDEALVEFDSQHFEEARSLFLRAHQLVPSARTHRALGLTEFELRNYVESVPHLEAALASTIKPLGETLRREVESTLARALGFVARLTVRLQPASGVVTLDNVRVEPDVRILAAIGEHTLRATAEGFETETRVLRVKGGEALSLGFALAPAQPPVARETRPDGGHPRPSRAWYKSPWLWTSVGIVLAGAAAGTAVLLTRPDSPQTFDGTTGVNLRGP